MALRGRNGAFNRASRARAQAFADAREEVVNLNATPFASTIDSPSIDIPTPVTVMGYRAEPEFNMADWYTNYLGSSEYQKNWTDAREKYRREAENEEDAFSGEFRGYGTGTGGAGYANDIAGADVFASKIKEEKPPLFIDAVKEFEIDYPYDYDTSKLFMKGPDTGYGTMSHFRHFRNSDEYNEVKKLRGPNLGGNSGSYVDISGGEAPIGSYSMIWVEDPPESSFFEKALNFAPFRVAAGYLSGGYSEAAIAAGKAVTGETLHASDWLSLAVPALESANIIAKPVQGATGVEAVGKGIAGLGYTDTVGLLSAAATGDPKSFIVSKFGNEALDKAFADVPQGSDLLGRFQADDVKAGLVKVVDKVAGGAEFDDALLAGLGKYIDEGGGLNLDGKDIDLGIVEDIVRNAVRPLGKIGTEVADIVKKSVSAIDTSALDPIEEAIREAGRTTEDVVRAGGKAVDKSVIQPTREVAKAFDDAVTQPVGDALSALDTAIRQALPDIDLPSVDLPSIDLPSMDLPFDLRPSLMSDTGEDFIPSPTRTTDSLFNDELFQFETEIGISDYPIESQGEELELFYPESALQLDYEPDYDNFFENTIYEAKPRSYDF